MSFWEAAFSQALLQNALIAGLLASISCGVIGTYVVVKRISYLAGGIAHAVLGGMGIAYFFQFNPLSGAIISALLAALLVGWVSLKIADQEDVVISALWSVGMAIGIIFISKSNGFNVDLLGYLFGNILLVASGDLYLIAALDILILMLVAIGYKYLLAISFDEEFAALRGVNVTFWYLLLLSMVALTVVVLIQVVGLILVIALMTLPAAIAGQFVRSLGKIMLVAVALSLIFSVGGLFLSYDPDLPTGPSIVLLAGCAYLATVLYTRFRMRLAKAPKTLKTS